MRSVVIANVIITCVIAVCITVAAIYFENASLLWWYVLLPLLMLSYKNEKDGADDE